MVVGKPPMGFNTWNTFGENYDEKVLKELVDTFCEKGLDKLGYNYFVIDDCWAEKERDKQGNLVPDPKKFPGGIRKFSDYVHAKGLKFGMYSCCGNMTCAGYPGSLWHEYRDAKQFAEWGADYLKYDYCHRSKYLPSEYLYRRMGLALANCGRDILFAACSWGYDDTEKWIRTTGASTYRNTGDIFDSWESIKTLTKARVNSDATHAINGYADMDMLVVGMNGKGNVGLSDGCTEEEYKTHFSVWCFYGSPLIIGADPRALTDKYIEILSNKNMIELDGDEGGFTPFDVTPATLNPEVSVTAKILTNGDIAVLMLNLSDIESIASFDKTSLSINDDAVSAFATDLWTGERKDFTNGMILETLKPHSCKVYRVSVSLT